MATCVVEQWYGIRGEGKSKGGWRGGEVENEASAREEECRVTTYLALFPKQKVSDYIALTP